MSCSARSDAIFLYAAGALEDGELRELVTHLETGCPRCAEALAHAHEALALLVLALDPVAPPLGARQRLLARAAHDATSHAARPAASLVARRPASAARRRAAIAAAAGALVGFGVAAGLAWRVAVAPLAARNAALEQALSAATAEIGELGGELASQDGELHALESDARLAAEQLHLLRAPDLETLALSAAPAGSAAAGRIFWDRTDYHCYFHAEGMAAPPAGRGYVLWVVSARGEFFAAARFAPDARGEVSLLTRLPKGFAPVASTLVTEEPREHGARPTGAVHLLGGETGAPGAEAS